MNDYLNSFAFHLLVFAKGPSQTDVTAAQTALHHWRLRYPRAAAMLAPVVYMLQCRYHHGADNRTISKVFTASTPRLRTFLLLSSSLFEMYPYRPTHIYRSQVVQGKANGPMGTNVRHELKLAVACHQGS